MRTPFPQPTRTLSLVISLASALVALWAPPSFGFIPNCGWIGVPCADYGDPDNNCDGSDGGGGDSNDDGCSGCDGGDDTGVARWSVALPSVGLRIKDTPLFYIPSRGDRVAWSLAYRQRGAVNEDPTMFGLGENWSCSFRSYLINLTNTSSVQAFRFHALGIAYRDYTNGVPNYHNGSSVNLVTAPEIRYSDGSFDIFGQTFTDSGGNTFYFRTVHADPAGHAINYNYAVGSSIKLTNVTDSDGLATSLYYENTIFTNQITKVVDPFLRTNLLYYDNSGYLTNIIDVAGLSSSFTYDAANPGWITNMVTTNGSTSFSYGGVDVATNVFYTGGNVVNRYAQITLPSGGTHLYLYRQEGTNFFPTSYSSLPTTAGLPNTLDDVSDKHLRNSLHWGPWQYEGLSTTNVSNLTSNDYRFGALRHWLIQDVSTGEASYTPSLARLPSPDGSDGEIVWYDYDGKSSGNNSIGTTALRSYAALVLPNTTTTRFINCTRNTNGLPTRLISTYTKTDGSGGLRTNTFIYDSSYNLDLLQQIGPNAEQVVSNYFLGGNIYHQPDRTYDALNQETINAYNGNRQIISVTRPGGLITTNVYFTTGYTNWLSSTADYNGSQTFRTNGFTYSNGLIYSRLDERGLNVTNYWDPLQHLVGTVYPDGTSISNIYTGLDVTAAKDRNSKWNYLSYNVLREKVAETNRLGTVTRYGYCTCGLLSARTNAFGTTAENHTSYAYDKQGNNTYTYLPDTTITRWFNSLRQVYQQNDGWATRSFYFNDQGLTTNRSDALGTELATTFDIEDRPICVTDANGVIVTNSYDLLGRLISRTYPDGGVEQFTYTARGLTNYINQLGKTSIYALDAAGRKTYETNANGEVIRYTNNASGDLLSLTDGKLQTTKWNYDEYGRATNKLDSSGTVILKYTYDPDSRLLSRWSVAKGTTYYTNDVVGNLTYVKYPASTSVSLAYDPLSRLTTMVDAVGTTAYGYTSLDSHG